jgi:hypothetical protein
MLLKSRAGDEGQRHDGGHGNQFFALIAVKAGAPDHFFLSVKSLAQTGSRCFSGEVDSPLDWHKIESASMVTLRCKRGETHLSHLIHLTERVPVIHR